MRSLETIGAELENIVLALDPCCSEHELRLQIQQVMNIGKSEAQQSTASTLCNETRRRACFLCAHRSKTLGPETLVPYVDELLALKALSPDEANELHQKIQDDIDMPIWKNDRVIADKAARLSLPLTSEGSETYAAKFYFHEQNRLAKNGDLEQPKELLAESKMEQLRIADRIREIAAALIKRCRRSS